MSRALALVIDQGPGPELHVRVRNGFYPSLSV
jgi:hypothetical protein